MNITPLSDRLLIKPLPDTKETELIIPDNAKEKPQRGEVIAAGEGKDGRPMGINTGDIVYFTKGAGIPFPDGLRMMRYGVEVIAVEKKHFASEGMTSDQA